jgi:hypothetical protein
MSVLTLFVLLGTVGVFGIRTRTATVSAAGYSLSLQYPFTDRAGEPVHWVLTVHREGGFPDTVDVGLTQSYLDTLDLNDIQPQSSDSKTVGPYVVWTFTRPAGEDLRISIDAQIQLNAHFGAEGTVAVFEEDKPVASLRFRTWTAP